MKKLFCFILTISTLIVTLVGCGSSTKKHTNTPPDTSSDTVSATSSGNTSSETASYKDLYDPYSPKIIDDSRIIVVKDSKTFSDKYITLSFPAEWLAIERCYEDASFYTFRHPDADETCQIFYCVTSSEYFREPTEAEYLQELENYNSQDIDLKVFKKDELDGYPCTKVVYSYEQQGKKLTDIIYERIVVGDRMYDLYVTYPSSEATKYESIFDSIINSVKFSSQ